MALKAILFDKDGTLVDFDKTWNAATYAVLEAITGGDRAVMERIARRTGYDLAARRILPNSVMVASSNADYGVWWAEELGVIADAAFFARMSRLFVEHGLETMTPIGDPAALMADLVEAGFTVGVVTNDSELGARAQCDRLGITPLLSVIIGYDSGYGRKPEPGQVLAFVAQAGLAPEEVALVGDSLHDLHAARAAGAMAIGVLSGHADEALLGPHADHVVDDIMSLPALIRSLPA